MKEQIDLKYFKMCSQTLIFIHLLYFHATRQYTVTAEAEEDFAPNSLFPDREDKLTEKEQVQFRGLETPISGHIPARRL